MERVDNAISNNDNEEQPGRSEGEEWNISDIHDIHTVCDINEMQLYVWHQYH